ncbi:MAG: hypothetical protein ACKVOW_16610 [Chitinophagaceae bacterium]
MKHLVITVVGIISFISCRKNNDVKNASGGCQLIQSTETGRSNIGTANESTYTITQNFEYNDLGFLTGNSFQVNSKNKSNKTSTNYSTNTYQYDAAGYLIKKVYNTSSSDFDGRSSKETQIYDYTYNNGRLVKVTKNWNGGSGSTIEMGIENTTHEYDAAGNLVKTIFAYSRDGGAINTMTYLYEYNATKLSKYSLTAPDGTTINYVIEVNNQGLITKLLNPKDAYENRYQYNNEGTQIIREDWRNGKKDRKRVFVFDNNKNVNAVLYGISYKKGFPKDFFGKSPFEGSHNVVKDQNYDINFTSGAENLYFTYGYTYQYNSNGLPITRVSKHEYASGVVSVEATTNYTYSICK